MWGVGSLPWGSVLKTFSQLKILTNMKPIWLKHCTHRKVILRNDGKKKEEETMSGTSLVVQ